MVRATPAIGDSVEGMGNRVITDIINIIRTTKSGVTTPIRLNVVHAGAKSVRNILSGARVNLENQIIIAFAIRRPNVPIKGIKMETIHVIKGTGAS